MPSKNFLVIVCLIGITGLVSGSPHLNRQGKHGRSPIREARLILPKEDNNGVPLTPLRGKLEARLLKAFGGFTSTEGHGGWESGSDNLREREVHHEGVWIYDIACPDDTISEAELTEIAAWLKADANQESVYLRLPSGSVLFI